MNNVLTITELTTLPRLWMAFDTKVRVLAVRGPCINGNQLLLLHSQPSGLNNILSTYTAKINGEHKRNIWGNEPQSTPRSCPNPH